MSPLEIVLHYHERTKHHPHRYARSLGYLDWATQPNPFRRFEGAPLIDLPHLPTDDTPPFEDLFVEGAITAQPLTAATLSRFLECSLAISAWKQFKDSRWALRVNPSSGNLHPTEGYLICNHIGDFIDEAGVYHYAPREHALEQRCRFSIHASRLLESLLPKPLFLFGLTSIYWREAWKYGERAFRYCQQDVGHALGALRVAAAMLGWRLVLIEPISDDHLSTLLGLNLSTEFEPAEAEHVDLLAAVIPDHAKATNSPIVLPEFVCAVGESTWVGQPNRLSKSHVPWEVIDWVHEATYRSDKPIESSSNSSSLDQTHSERGSIELPVQRLVRPQDPRVDSRARLEPQSNTARHIIRKRRSALGFDGTTHISADQFFRILSGVVPRDMKSETAMPFDVWTWSPRIHFFMFVHRVSELPPGLYALIRDRAQVDRIRAATKPEFEWTSPKGCPVDLPLYFLVEADCRRAAKVLSLHQDIAGDGVFSLGMIAEFRRSLNELGPWFYKRLFWEAGFVGQLLYLEAEAAGIRATGIGAYFDDPVHEVFGFDSDEFQSMYHFTMGGPVDDPRLTTLPAYPEGFEPG